MDTAEDFFVRFHTVADDTAAAVRTNRRQRVDCAFKAVENVTLSAHNDFKRLVIIIPANFAFSHTQFVRARRGEWRCLFAVANEIRSQLTAWDYGAVYRFAPEILLVLNEAESYHWSPLLRVGAVVHANTRRHRGRCPLDR